MIDEPQNTALALLGKAGASLPLPVKTGLLGAFNNLLGGLTSIPAAWIKRPAQAVEDTTAARSAVSAALAQAVAKEAMNDPVVMQAAAEIFLPSGVRKARNRVQVALKAAEHAAESKPSDTTAAPPSDDWMNVFARFAEDASSEKLQDMFGRILSGQVTKPGAFSVSTLRTVAELDQSTAQDFTMVWARSVGAAVDYSPDFQRGEWFSRWARLSEVGLMSPRDTSQFLPLNHSIWTPFATEYAHITIVTTSGCNARWAHIDFTRTGRELGSILPTPNYAVNMKDAALRLVQPGIARIVLEAKDKPLEIIYTQPTAPA